MKTVIPIFFTANDAQSPFVATALCSIKENASPDYTYQVHILFDDISEDNQNRILALAEAGFCIEFNPLAACLPLLPGVQTLQQSNPGAYATLTNNLCFFIPDLFPQYDKAVCLDIDLVVTGDISCLYREYLGTKLVGAVVDSSIQKVSPVLRYIDTYIGVDHQNYVNSGVLLLNCVQFRSQHFAARFMDLWAKTHLDTVVPCQDWLNALCRQEIHYLDPEWNAMPSDCIQHMDDPKIVHFCWVSKPWQNECVPYDSLFWRYAAASGFDKEIRSYRQSYLQNPTAIKNTHDAITNLIRKAARLTVAPESFRSLSAV